MKSRGIIIAWLIGEGIIIYRGAAKEKRPPWPSELLFSSVVFVSLGFLAEIESAATLAVLLAFGFDIAAFMNLAPSLPINKPAPTAGAATAPAVQPSAGGTTGVGPAK